MSEIPNQSVMMDDPLFLDTFTHSLDAQCRVSLPSGWRSPGGMDFVLFAIEDKSLALMPQKLFRTFLADAQKQVITNPAVRRVFSAVAGKAKPLRQTGAHGLEPGNAGFCGRERSADHDRLLFLHPVDRSGKCRSTE